MQQQDAQAQDGTAAGAAGQEVYTFPLSHAQQGLWLLSQLQLQNPAYHIPNGYELRGPLRVDVLERALTEIVSRHEVLRTTFAVLDGEPAQVVAPADPRTVEVIDLSGIAAEDRDAEAARVATEEATRPFDLAKGPLLRLVLVRLEEERHLLLATAHHLVFDGWSEGVFLRELTVLYGAFAVGGESPLEELAVQYGDYAHWEREWLESDEAAPRLDYWRAQLADAPDTLELPTDRPRPEEPGYAGGYRSFEVPADVAARLTDAGRAEGATPFATLLAAWGVLLHRLSGQERVLVGSPVANRAQVELEEMAGFFVDSLVLGVDAGGDPTFREMVGRVRDTTFAAHEHALPFAHIVGKLKPRRDAGRNPYFQVLFNFDTASPQSSSAADAGLSIAPYSVATGTAQFDLVLSLQDTGDGLRGTLSYATDLFDASTADRIVRRLEIVLRRAAEDPSRRIADLLLDDEERRQVVHGWNDTARDYDRADRCVHELIAAQAARTPHTIALESEAGTMTYGELEAAADAMAARLRSAGVGAESVVAIHLDRSAEMVVAALAAMKAGGAYLPVDPSYPAARRLFMLEDAGARVLVTSAALRSALPVPCGVTLLLADDDSADAQPCPASPESASSESVSTDASSVSADADGLAYVIYTSGSTGKPKGAMNAHRGVVNRLLWMQDAYSLGAGDAVLQKTPFSFDVSVWELFWPLISGARLVLARPEGHKDPTYLRDVIAQSGITTLHFVPSMLRPFLENDGLEACAALKRVVCSGEALPADLRDRFAARLPGVALHNLYGPTECAVDVTHWTCGADGGATVPIGRPVANTGIHVVGADGQPVPAGFPGELCIAGVQVGRGYLARPAMTAERFVPDPFSATPGARMYRTGDLARRRDDGVVEFLGRLDHQVKVRGFRIELGEIEAAVASHPQVREAAVLARTDGPGGVRLVAYVVKQGDEQPAAADLRAHLSSRLPEHMVPAAFVPMDALPLTPSGKLDRRALPEPGPERAGVEEAYTAPHNVVEDTLATIWGSVLGIEQVGVHDNFFALGGDSILSLRIAAMARERGLHVSIRQVFRNPTVAGLASALEADRLGQDVEIHTQPFSLIGDEDRARMPEGAVDAYPLSRTQLGMLYHQEKNADAPLYHGLTSFLLRLPFDGEAMERAVMHTVDRHPNLRTGFDLSSFSEPMQVVYAASSSPLEVTDLRDISGDEQQAHLKAYWLAEQDRAFDLPVPPQMRFHVHRLTDETVQFTLVENHAVSDGWSLHTVLADALAAYFALLAGGGLPELPALRTAFRDFIALERRTLASAEAKEFWNQQVDGFEPSPLVAPGTEPVREGGRIAKVDRLLRRSLVAQLRKVARRQAVPLKSVLLAAHLRVLAHFTGREDIATGLSTNGRPETGDGDKVAGLFLNTVPLRAELSGGTWNDLIRRVHESELAVMPHRRYPLSAIQAGAGGRTLFDASFVYLNFHVVADHVRSSPMEVLATSAVVEETNFAIMTSFQHVPGDDTRIGITVEGDRWLLGDERIRAIAAAYRRVLRAIAADPEGRYESFSPLSVAERSAFLASASGDAVPPLAQPVHRAFEDWTQRTPDAPCVESAASSLSYGEVDAAANRLARRLREMGIGAESRVAICMDRVPEIVPAVLAAWKAGAAYVPLDPTYPADRLAFVLRDSGASAVVTLDRWRDRVASAGIPVVSLDGDADALASLDGTPLSVDEGRRADFDPSALAYVVYTSGTTGRPKGVAVEHGQVMHYAAAAIDLVRPEAGMRHGLASTFAADLGNTVLFPALATGGTLRVLSDAEATDPSALGAGLAGKPLDVLKIVPSHLRALLSHERPAELLPRHALVLGGDRADWALADSVRAHVPGCRVLNHYGPTETTVGVVAGELEPASRARPAAPPLGKPLGHARIYLLDAHGQPVPAGTPGEVYVGGPVVARGYPGRASLTAQRFLPDAFSSVPGARMYRTGDVARRLEDGRLEFAGRADAQVKVRGYRVEPGEVETLLRAHPAVAQAAVTARGEGGDVQLAAYVVAAEGQPAPEAELRKWVEDHLPAYMVPSRFVALAALPLTANGKLDRRALPAPDAVAAEAEATVTPRSEIEEKLAEIWSAVLKVPAVGVYDDFFALGGDSIRAILTAARVRKAFGVSISVESLLGAGTVAGLAGVVEMSLSSSASAPAEPIVAIDRAGEMPLSFGQQRIWFAHLLDPDSPAHTIPHVFRMRGRLDADAWRAAVNEVVRRHEVLRTAFPTVDGEPRQSISAHLAIDVPLIDLGHVPEAERDACLADAAREIAWAPFDLDTGPLVRAALIRAADDDHVAVLALHHVVYDGWSAGVLLREMATLYAAFADGQPSPLPELPVQYADFAAWQRRHLDDAALAEETAWWVRRLEGIRPLEVPTDHPRPDVQTYRGASEGVVLSTELTAALGALGRREGVTQFMALLAAWSGLLGHLSNQDDVVVGAPVAIHRDRAELGDVIGLFLNSLPLRVDLGQEATFRELLRRVRKASLEAFAHQDVPFEKVVEALPGKRDTSRNPVFQAWFNYSVPGQPLEIAGLELEGVDVGDPAVKFDLRLSAEEGDGRLVLNLGYNADLFERDTALGILRRLAGMLERAVERPEAGLAELCGGGAAAPAAGGKEAPESFRLHLQGIKRRAFAIES
jgi:amino acid adenylation domain-containing protein